MLTQAEATLRLRSLLDAQAARFERAPAVVFVEHNAGSHCFVRIFAVDGDGVISALDFLLRVANGVEPLKVGQRQESGDYKPETGWRLDGANQPTTASVYDLLLVLGVDFVRTINIREVY